VDAMPEAIKTLKPAFGRMEKITAGERNIVLAFVKNPISYNTTLRTIMARPGKKHLLSVHSNAETDGEDFAWLWDIDLEEYASQIATLVTSGKKQTNSPCDSSMQALPRNAFMSFLTALQPWTPHLPRWNLAKHSMCSPAIRHYTNFGESWLDAAGSASFGRNSAVDPMTLRICHLYPTLLSVAGDRGNLFALQRRCEWRGLQTRVTEIGVGQRTDFTNFDIILFHGGQRQGNGRRRP